MDFSKMTGLWQAVLLKPQPTLAAQAKSKATLMDGLTGYVIAAIISGIISVISLMLLSSAALKSPLLGTMSNPLFVLIFAIVMGLVSSFVMAGLVHLASKLLGGKGSFTQLYYLLSIIAVPIAVLNVVTIIPVLGGILGLVVSLYSLYLWVLAGSKLYGMTMMRSAGAVLIAVVVVMAVAFVFAMFTAAGLVASGAAAGLAGY
ncbi:MAG: YIP1 family protein [Candidatus Marsarchaeota archaeon]|nr:YIP1 family protein [Candidatus Marsarchaeota archaeon]